MEGELHCESRPAAATRTLAEPELVADQHSAGGTLRVKTHVLHADDFLALMLADGVPDRHVVGGQMQLVGTGQRVIKGERIRRHLDRLV